MIQFACKKPLSAVQHGPEVPGEQLGFWSAQPRWALDVLVRWSPWTCIWPYGIQLYSLLSWMQWLLITLITSCHPSRQRRCTKVTQLTWTSSTSHCWRRGAQDLRELPQGGRRREEGRRVKESECNTRYQSDQSQS